MVSMTDQEREARLAVALVRRQAAARACGDGPRARRHEKRACVLAERLLRSLRPLVRGLARRMAPYVRHAGLDAADLEQESFLCLLNAMYSYDPARASVRTFMARVLYNRFVGFGRRRGPEAVADLEPALARREAEGARREELRRQVADVAGDILTDDPQQALKVALFRAYFFEGRTLQELADASGLALTTVHRYVGQARRAFRAAFLAGEPGGPARRFEAA
jgi:RNA polymerase sigma factor (sigma-70 family)